MVFKHRVIKGKFRFLDGSEVWVIAGYMPSGSTTAEHRKAWMAMVKHTNTQCIVLMDANGDAQGKGNRGGDHHMKSFMEGTQATRSCILMW